MIPYGRQNITEDDLAAVIETLRSDYLTQGPRIPEFENAVSQLVEANYSVAVNSATSALHISCVALGLEDGSLLWTSPNTFVASSNCALYCGAAVDFVDIDLNTYTIDIQALEEKLEIAKHNNRLPDVLVAVHLGGQSCDMKKISQLSKQYGFKVIEDASHCIGGHYDNRLIGNCDYSDICIFSFHPVKIITTVEGGLATTNDEELFNRLQRLRTHGITRDPAFMHEQNNYAWHYEQLELGFNYRMTDVQAALGTSQLKRIHENIAKRRALAARYKQMLADLPVACQQANEQGDSAWHIFVIRLLNVESLEQKSVIFNELRSSGIGVNVHYIPVHTQPYYKALGFEWGMFPNAEKYYTQALTIPLFPELEDNQQDYIVEQLTKVL